MKQTIILQDKNITKLSNEKLVLKRTELKEIIKEAEALLDQVNETLMERIKKEGKKGVLEIGDNIARIIQKPVYKDITLLTAVKYNAIKTAIDTAKILELVKEGRKIKGFATSSYITVR